jgi:hypothetical protein
LEGAISSGVRKPRTVREQVMCAFALRAPARQTSRDRDELAKTKPAEWRSLAGRTGRFSQLLARDCVDFPTERTTKACACDSTHGTALAASNVALRDLMQPKG